MAISLKMSTDPLWISLINGADLHVAPPTSYLVAVARARADLLFAELMQSGEAVTRVGARLEGFPDLSTPEGAKGVHDGLFALSLAEMATDDWRNVLDADGVPLKFNAGLLALLFTTPGVPDAFVNNYMNPLNAVVTEGNA